MCTRAVCCLIQREPIELELPAQRADIEVRCKAPEPLHGQFIVEQPDRSRLRISPPGVAYNDEHSDVDRVSYSVFIRGEFYREGAFVRDRRPGRNWKCWSGAVTAGGGGTAVGGMATGVRLATGLGFVTLVVGALSLWLGCCWERRRLTDSWVHEEQLEGGLPSARVSSAEETNVFRRTSQIAEGGQRV
jgi:hypothetical protein